MKKTADDWYMVVNSIFEEATRWTGKPANGLHVPRKVQAQKGATTWTFEQGSDEVWRLTYIDTYGNGSFVNGGGCDASGYVVDDEFIDWLEEV